MTEISLAMSLRRLDASCAFQTRAVFDSRAIIIADECWRESAEAEHPDMQVIGPRDIRPGATCLAEALAEYESEHCWGPNGVTREEWEAHEREVALIRQQRLTIP